MQGKESKGEERNGEEESVVRPQHINTTSTADLFVKVVRGPASPHLITPLHFLVEVRRVIACAASLPHP